MRTGLDYHSCALPRILPGFTKGKVAPADLGVGVNSAAGWREVLRERMVSVVTCRGYPCRGCAMIFASFQISS